MALITIQDVPIVGSAIRDTLTSRSDVVVELGVTFIGEGVAMIKEHKGDWQKDPKELRPRKEGEKHQ
jgi:hypothetical protein